MLELNNIGREREITIKRIINGLKDGLFVLISVFIVALILNYTGWNFGHNRIWDSLGKLELIHVFNDQELNGLIILGIVLGSIAFVLGFIFPNDDKQNAE